MMRPGDTKSFRSVLEALSAFVPEAVLRIRGDGLYLKALDPAQVVLVEMHAPRSFFTVYDVEERDIGVNIEELVRVLSRHGSMDVVDMEVEDNELKVVMRGPTLVREFSLPILDIPFSDVRVDVPESNVTATLRAGVFRDILKDASLVSSEVVTLRSKGGAFYVESRGSLGWYRVKVEGVVKGEGESSYSLPHLLNITKGSSDVLTLSYATDSPLVVRYNVRGISLSFTLAHIML